MKVRPVGAQAVPYGRADTRKDTYDKAKSRFSQFCEKRLKSSSDTPCSLFTLLIRYIHSFLLHPEADTSHC